MNKKSLVVVIFSGVLVLTLVMNQIRALSKNEIETIMAAEELQEQRSDDINATIAEQEKKCQQEGDIAACSIATGLACRASRDKQACYYEYQENRRRKNRP